MQVPVRRANFVDRAIRILKAENPNPLGLGVCQLTNLTEMILISSTFQPQMLLQSARVGPTRYKVVDVESGHFVEDIRGWLLILEAGHELRRIGLECAIQRTEPLPQQFSLRFREAIGHWLARMMAYVLRPLRQQYEAGHSTFNARV